MKIERYDPSQVTVTIESVGPVRYGFGKPFLPDFGVPFYYHNILERLPKVSKVVIEQCALCEFYSPGRCGDCSGDG